MRHLAPTKSYRHNRSRNHSGLTFNPRRNTSGRLTTQRTHRASARFPAQRDSRSTTYSRRMSDTSAQLEVRQQQPAPPVFRYRAHAVSLHRKTDRSSLPRRRWQSIAKAVHCKRSGPSPGSLVYGHTAATRSLFIRKQQLERPPSTVTAPP